MERIEYKYPQVVKKDGTRQPFDPDKVLAGFRLACRKRPVTPEELQQAVERLSVKLRGTQVGEIPSARLGKLVLEELRDLDMVAYLRFASVYQEVQSAEDFLELLQPWVGTLREGGDG